MVDINIKPGSVVELAWLDSSSSTGWMTIDDAVKEKGSLYTCRSVGYLLHYDNEFVVINQSICLGNRDVQNTIAVPRVSITAMKSIGKGVRSEGIG